MPAEAERVTMASHELDEATRAQVVPELQALDRERRRDAQRTFAGRLVAAAAAVCFAIALHDQWIWLPLGCAGIAGMLVFDAVMELRAGYTFSLEPVDLLDARGADAVATRTPQYAGGPRIEAGAWCFDTRDGPVRIPLDELCYVAERSIEPTLDDEEWLLVLGTRDGWWEFPYASGAIEQPLAALARELGAPRFEFKLLASVTRESRLLWPPDLVGRPALVEHAYPKWKQWLTLGRIGYVLELSSDARGAIARRAS